MNITFEPANHSHKEKCFVVVMGQFDSENNRLNKRILDTLKDKSVKK